MPVIDGEASYEMLNDSLPTEWTRRMFWLCLMNGAAGHTYGANGIWQCNRPDQPHGASPHGGTYGKIPWNEAMNLPGSRQVGLGKKLLEQYPWQRFQPHPEWAAFAGESPLSLDGCQWIWFPEGNPAQDAPVAKRFCRRTFVLPEGKAVERARLRVSADDWFAARLNGETLGSGDDWNAGRQFNDLARLLKPGTNVLAIVAENKPANVPANPAGLIACLEIRFADGETLEVGVRRHWRWAKSEASGWDTAGFDDAAWAKALAVGPLWRCAVGSNRPAARRVLRAASHGHPRRRAGHLRAGEPAHCGAHLDPHTAYAATYFDPVSGAKTALPAVHPDDAGLWVCPFQTSLAPSRRSCSKNHTSPADPAMLRLPVPGIVCDNAPMPPSRTPRDFVDEMKYSWNRRARVNASWFINTLKRRQSEREFDESGRCEVDRLLRPDLDLVTQGRDPATLRLLEIGCGTGRMTRFLAGIFGEVVATDVRARWSGRPACACETFRTSGTARPTVWTFTSTPMVSSTRRSRPTSTNTCPARP